MPSFDFDSIDISGDDPDEIFEELGLASRGNHGSVVRARHLPSNEIVAIKKVLLKDEFEIEAIVREVVLLRKCDHKNIVRYLSAYKSLSHLWIVMEYCEAGSLDLVYKILHHPLPEKLIGYVCREILHGLAYLHRHKILHRDVKASNVLLTRDGQVKLADFGVSTELAHSMSRRNTFTGTVLWMSPETIQQADHDDRADVWSLGITVIEMAQGAPPRMDIPAPRVVFVIAWEEAPTLQHKENWSPQMNMFIKRLLTKDKALRPSAAAMLADSFVHPAAVGTVGEMAQMMEELCQRRAKLGEDRLLRGDFSNTSTDTFVAHRQIRQRRKHKSDHAAVHLMNSASLLSSMDVCSRASTFASSRSLSCASGRSSGGSITSPRSTTTASTRSNSNLSSHPGSHNRSRSSHSTPSERDDVRATRTEEDENDKGAAVADMRYRSTARRHRRRHNHARMLPVGRSRTWTPMGRVSRATPARRGSGKALHDETLATSNEAERCGAGAIAPASTATPPRTTMQDIVDSCDVNERRSYAEALRERQHRIAHGADAVAYLSTASASVSTAPMQAASLPSSELRSSPPLPLLRPDDLSFDHLGQEDHSCGEDDEGCVSPRTLAQLLHVPLPPKRDATRKKTTTSASTQPTATTTTTTASLQLSDLIGEDVMREPRHVMQITRTLQRSVRYNAQLPQTRVLTKEEAVLASALHYKHGTWLRAIYHVTTPDVT